MAASRCLPASSRSGHAPLPCRCIRSSSLWDRPSDHWPMALASSMAARCRHCFRAPGSCCYWASSAPGCSSRGHRPTRGLDLGAISAVCCGLVYCGARIDGGPSGKTELAPSAIGRDTLLRPPQALRHVAGLPEHVDRDAAARIPVAADAEPFRLDLSGDALADGHRAILVEGAVVAER